VSFGIVLSSPKEKDIEPLFGGFEAISGMIFYVKLNYIRLSIYFLNVFGFALAFPNIGFQKII
jgi:hypothetical protein